MTLDRDAALALMTEYTQSESLRKHMLAVEAAVSGYARLWGEPEEDWSVVALLHDFDYERWPDAEEVAIADPDALEGFALTDKAASVIARGVAMARDGGPWKE